MKEKIVYQERIEYFPKEIRKKYKLGEYASPKEEVTTKTSKVKTKGKKIQANITKENEQTK